MWKGLELNGMGLIVICYKLTGKKLGKETNSKRATKLK
jgi:hypothetical protein